MSSFENAGIPSTQHYPGQGYAGEYTGPRPGVPGPGVPGPYTAPVPYGPGQAQAGPSPAGMSLPRGFGEILLAAGGLLFFIASFLTWVSFDFGISTDPCVGISDPDLQSQCAASFGGIFDGFSSNGWDLILISAAAVIMILLAATAVAVIARLVPAARTTWKGVAMGLAAVDIFLVTFFGFYDFSSLGSSFTADITGGVDGLSGSSGSGLSLGIGFTLALVGLLVAHLGTALAQLSARGAAQQVR